MTNFLAIIIQMYIWVLFAYIIMTWLLNFNIISTGNEIVMRLFQALRSLCEPVLTPIRRFVPPLSGIDFSPLVLLLGLSVMRSML